MLFHASDKRYFLVKKVTIIFFNDHLIKVLSYFYLIVFKNYLKKV